MELGWDLGTPEPHRAQVEAAQEPQGVTAPPAWERRGRARTPIEEGVGVLAAQQRRDRWGTAGCSGRGDGDTRTDGARQGQNSPLMQVWEPRGASPPRGLGTDIEAMSTRDSPGPPALGSRTNTTDIQRKEEVAGRCIACLLSLLARPQFSLGHASSNCLPSPMAVPQLPEVSSSQLGLEWRRNPRAALPAAHPGHLYRQRRMKCMSFTCV